MELRAHDLIRFKPSEDFFAQQQVRQWAQAAIHQAPYGVVRRDNSSNKGIPIGIRGKQRAERFACWMKEDHILEVITPFELTGSAYWKTQYKSQMPKTITSLLAVSPILNATGFKWGPVGSTGFELATGKETIMDTSDLDLVIYFSDFISASQAGEILKEIQRVSLTRLDVQMQTPAGGVAMAEYALQSKVLIKAADGPRLSLGETLWDFQKKQTQL